MDTSMRYIAGYTIVAVVIFVAFVLVANAEQGLDPGLQGTLDVECDGVPTAGNVQICIGTVHQNPVYLMAVELITGHFASPPPGGWPDDGHVSVEATGEISPLLDGGADIPPVWTFKFGLANVPCDKGRPYADIYLKCIFCWPAIQDEVHLELHCRHFPLIPGAYTPPTPTPLPPRERP